MFVDLDKDWEIEFKNDRLKDMAWKIQFKNLC